MVIRTCDVQDGDPKSSWHSGERISPALGKKMKQAKQSIFPYPTIFPSLLTTWAIEAMGERILLIASHPELTSRSVPVRSQVIISDWCTCLAMLWLTPSERSWTILSAVLSQVMMSRTLSRHPVSVASTPPLTILLRHSKVHYVDLQDTFYFPTGHPTRFCLPYQHLPIHRTTKFLIGDLSDR